MVQPINISAASISPRGIQNLAAVRPSGRRSVLGSLPMFVRDRYLPSIFRLSAEREIMLRMLAKTPAERAAIRAYFESLGLVFEPISMADVTPTETVFILLQMMNNDSDPYRDMRDRMLVFIVRYIMSIDDSQIAILALRSMLHSIELVGELRTHHLEIMLGYVRWASTQKQTTLVTLAKRLQPILEDLIASRHAVIEPELALAKIPELKPVQAEYVPTVSDQPEHLKEIVIQPPKRLSPFARPHIRQIDPVLQALAAQRVQDITSQKSAHLLPVILTHPSVSLRQDYLDQIGVEVIAIQENFNEDDVRKLCQNLIEKEFCTIVGILPTNHLWPKGRMVRSVLGEFDGIEVVDVPMIGVGLSVFIHHSIDKIMRHNRMHQMKGFLEPDARGIYYWALIDLREKTEYPPWLNLSSLEGSADRFAVANLKDGAGLEGHYQNHAIAARKLQILVDEALMENPHLSRIIISENKAFALALEIDQRLKEAFPDLRISMVPSGYFLAAELGRHICICCV